jgi:hypothetical protein
MLTFYGYRCGISIQVKDVDFARDAFDGYYTHV